MAVKIEALSDLSIEHQSEILEKMAEFFVDSKKWADFDSERGDKGMVDIEVDGIIYTVPEPVNELLNSIYRMYEKAIIKQDAEK
tara:strand:- start:27167 stop:27418 length:252 start_codon:yes stop_codon:yes gene_type:complete